MNETKISHEEQPMQLFHSEDAAVSPPVEGKCAFVLAQLAGRVNVDT